MPRKKKLFVLDTNVILHDSSCLHQFEQHDIVIPITVMEELDQFKKGHQALNCHAREFVRALDALSEDTIFNGGVALGPKLGKIRIQLERDFHPDLARNFASEKTDHHILNIAYHLSKENQQVVLVTKDVNLRLKAKSIGLIAQDYKSDRIKDLAALYTGYRIEEHVTAEARCKHHRDHNIFILYRYGR